MIWPRPEAWEYGFAVFSRRHREIPTVAAVVLLLALVAAGAAAELAIPTGVAQLFIGDRLIGKNLEVTRTLHQPRKDGGGLQPVLFLEDEFKGKPGTLQGGTILFDRKLNKYVMFATAGAYLDEQPWDWIRVYRFTSVDGLNWTKGDHGEPECVFPRSRDDLLDPASGAHATNPDLTTFRYDESDPAYPYQGWIWYANWGDAREGMYFVRSADGHVWERGPQVARMESFRFETDTHVYEGPYDASGFTYDPAHRRFIASLKISARIKARPSEYYRARAYYAVEALDQPIAFDPGKLVRLEPTRRHENGDEPNDEYYFSDSWRYESVWLGALKIHHENVDYPYSKAGCCFLKLVYSADGLHWQKVPYPNDSGIAEVFLPNGIEGGNDGRNDGGYVTTFQNPPLRIGDELIYYYASSSFGKNHTVPTRLRGGGIFRARLRVDGFVSVDSGTLVTVPLTTPGENLFVNHAGAVSVDLLDRNDAVLATAGVTGDSILHRVEFPGRVGDLVQTGAFKLRFSVSRGSQLYSFQFR